MEYPQSFEYVEITGATAHDRGLCYGHKARAAIRACVEHYRNRFARSSPRSWGELRAFALSHLPLIEAEMPDVLEEAKGIAAGAGVDFADLMVLNCRYEITKQPDAGECTTAAVLPRAGGGRTYLVKNWDYGSGILDHILVLHIEQPDGTRILGLTEAGQLIREGFNSRGVGICNNALRSIHDGPGEGIPVTFLRRRVLSAHSFDEAKRTVFAARRSVSNNILLADGGGQAVDIEAAPTGCELIEPVADILTHANHFTVRTDIESRPVSGRDVRLRSCLMEKWGRIDVPYIKTCMCDHTDAPGYICLHPAAAPEGEDCDMTVAGMVIDFAEGVAHICAGPPCCGEYLKYLL